MLCAGLLVAFTALAWSAVRGKSPTFDEPYHAMGGWLKLWHGEFRFDAENPPLWSMLAATLAGPNDIHVDLRRPNWEALTSDASEEYRWAIGQLFQTPGNDGVTFVAKFRVVMLGVGLTTGAFLAAFVWRLALSLGVKAGAAGAGAVFATGLFALDPNFLAHAPLMKNDVASSLALLGVTACTWEAGRRLTPVRIAALGIWSGVAVTVKFNGPLLVATSATLLLLRAVLPWPWLAGMRKGAARALNSAISRLVAATATLAAMGLTALAIIWLCYGLRFAPVSQPRFTADVPASTLR